MTQIVIVCTVIPSRRDGLHFPDNCRISFYYRRKLRLQNRLEKYNQKNLFFVLYGELKNSIEKTRNETWIFFDYKKRETENFVIKTHSRRIEKTIETPFCFIPISLSIAKI